MGENLCQVFAWLILAKGRCLFMPGVWARLGLCKAGFVHGGVWKCWIWGRDMPRYTQQSLSYSQQDCPLHHKLPVCSCGQPMALLPRASTVPQPAGGRQSPLQGHQQWAQGDSGLLIIFYMSWDHIAHFVFFSSIFFLSEIMIRSQKPQLKRKSPLGRVRQVRDGSLLPPAQPHLPIVVGLRKQ